MKVVFVVRNFPKLTETFILNQICGVIDLGNEVKIIADKPSDKSVEQSIIQEYELKKHTYYHDIPSRPSGKVYNAALQAASVGCNYPTKLKPIIQNQWNSPKNGVQILSRSKPFLENNSDIIHSHFGSVSKYCADLKQSGVITSPLVASFHGIGVRHALNTDNHVYHDLFQEADLILANSESIRNDLIRLGANGQKVNIHYHGIDTRKFTPKEPNIRKDTKNITILSVGRLTEEKGHIDGLEAVSEIISEYKKNHIEYRIVGGGELKYQLERKISRLNITDNVTLCGPMTHEGVIEEMEQADIFFHPSRNEGFGMVLLEAQAMGLPIVATDVGGIPEAVDDDNSALLSPEGNIESMSSDLSTIISSPDLATKLSKNGRKYIKEKYSMEVLNRELVELYESII